MNNRYLYRAKRIDNGEWILGSLIQTSYLGSIRSWISSEQEDKARLREISSNRAVWRAFEVRTDTICQCTAIPDKNRKIAYEHDIIKTPVGNAKIAWSCSKIPTDNHINVGFGVVFLDAIANDNYRHDLGYWIGKSEVIGSVFDNPELLEVGE